MGGMPTWDPQLYLTFGGERTQPAIDLVARVELGQPRRIIDLGCGPGNSTALLRGRWPEAEVTGLDSSREMLAAAGENHPGWRWVEGDIGTWEADSSYDLVFSNAALQWVPRHAEVFPRLLASVAAGGALAVQMPAHFQSPVHQLILDTAAAPEWRHLTRAAAEAIAIGRPSFYYDLLAPRCARIEIWETEYNHVLAGPGAIIDWMSGTGLRPFLEALETEEQRTAFRQRLLAGLSAAYPRQRDGRILFPFRRLFLVAYR